MKGMDCFAALRQEVQELLVPTQALAESGIRVPRELWGAGLSSYLRLPCGAKSRSKSRRPS